MGCCGVRGDEDGAEHGDEQEGFWGGAEGGGGFRR